MIASEKTHQSLSDYKQFLLKKKQILSSEKLRNSGNCILIMLTRYSEIIFNPMRYTGLITGNVIYYSMYYIASNIIY